MSKTILFLTLTIMFILQTEAYDYYKFAVELPGAVCRSKSCTSAYMGGLSAYTLNMHGMWPNSNDGSSAENCLANNYDESQFSSNILSELNNDWVGLYSSSSSFRSHEWGKHGTCWAQQNENPGLNRFLGSRRYGTTSTPYFQAMNDYFSKAMSVKNSLNIEAAIFKVRQAEVQTTLQDIQSALNSQLGVSTIDLYCSSNLLTEIRFCIDLDYAPMECPDSPNIQCPSSGAITIVGTIN